MWHSFLEKWDHNPLFCIEPATKLTRLKINGCSQVEFKHVYLKENFYCVFRSIRKKKKIISIEIELLEAQAKLLFRNSSNLKLFSNKSFPSIFSSKWSRRMHLCQLHDECQLSWQLSTKVESWTKLGVIISQDNAGHAAMSHPQSVLFAGISIRWCRKKAKNLVVSFRNVDAWFFGG